MQGATCWVAEHYGRTRRSWICPERPKNVLCTGHGLTPAPQHAWSSPSSAQKQETHLDYAPAQMHAPLVDPHKQACRHRQLHEACGKVNMPAGPQRQRGASSTMPQYPHRRSQYVLRRMKLVDRMWSSQAMACPQGCALIIVVCSGLCRFGLCTSRPLHQRLTSQPGNCHDQGLAPGQGPSACSSPTVSRYGRWNSWQAVQNVFKGPEGQAQRRITCSSLGHEPWRPRCPFRG